MLSMTGTEPPGRNFAVDELVIDSALGLCPLVVIGAFGVVAAWAYFILPMVVLAPIAYVVMGALRGKSHGILWLKALCLSGAAILFAGILGKKMDALIFAGLAIPFTALGVWLRRRGWLF